MKYHFKYKSGYINIDEENLYLTTSGNWKETLNTYEKSPCSINKNQTRKIYKVLYYWILYATFFIIFNIVYSFFSLKFWIIVAILLAIVTSLLFHFYRRDFGIRYKIPLHKIDSINIIDKKDIKINFKNLDQTADYEILKDADHKLIAYLKILIKEKSTLL